ncbi:glycosyltransferase family 2 protein [Agromyces seonyuensis]|uniref:Glycosyltransferase n=1 Tax=Agromyces seonyuensis TaxID=2662446 RepID=A0A6I4P6H5_9MICO|nr:glycosyltransferase family 2 protein [Agromyces seonyuensis]MWB99234.1 glycosyltransferase [Agromyces seonyuensis]
MNEMRAPERILIVTVAYDSDAVLPTFLDSVSAATSAPVALAVADNAASDSTRRIAEQYGAGYLALDNPGYGTAANAAVRAFGAEADWVLVANPDVTLGPGSLDVLAAVGVADPAIGSLGPLITDADGTVYPSARQLPRIVSGAGHVVFRNLWPSNPFSAAYRRANEAPVDRDAEWLSGACLLIRRTAFDEVGGFDEGYFMYFEDVDLGARLLEAGWRNHYAPAAAVVHTGAHSTAKSMTKMSLAHHESASRFLQRRYRGPAYLPVRLVLRAAIGLRARLTSNRR